MFKLQIYKVQIFFVVLFNLNFILSEQLIKENSQAKTDSKSQENSKIKKQFQNIKDLNIASINEEPSLDENSHDEFDDELEDLDESALIQLLQENGFKGLSDFLKIDSVDGDNTGNGDNKLTEEEVQEFLKMVQNLAQEKTLDK